MRILIDTSLLVEGERRSFDLGRWVVAARHEVFICDVTVAEYIAGRPSADAGKGQRWQNYWESFVSLLESAATKIRLPYPRRRNANSHLWRAYRGGVSGNSFARIARTDSLNLPASTSSTPQITS